MLWAWFLSLLQINLIWSSSTNETNEVEFSCLEVTANVYRSISDFTNLFASSNSTEIIWSLIPSLKEINDEVVEARMLCRQVYINHVLHSKSPSDAYLCLYNLENLSFRSTYAIHAFVNTNDQAYALQNLRELSASIHGFISNCTSAVLSFVDDKSKTKCNAKRKIIAETHKVAQKKMFLQDAEDELDDLEQNITSYIKDCIDFKEDSKLVSTKSLEIGCSLQLMKIQDQILSATILDLVDKKKRKSSGLLYRRLLIYETQTCISRFQRECIDPLNSAYEIENKMYESCKFYAKEAQRTLVSTTSNRYKKFTSQNVNSWSTARQFAKVYEELSTKCSSYVNGGFIRIPRRPLLPIVKKFVGDKKIAKITRKEVNKPKTNQSPKTREVRSTINSRRGKENKRERKEEKKRKQEIDKQKTKNIEQKKKDEQKRKDQQQKNNEEQKNKEQLKEKSSSKQRS